MIRDTPCGRAEARRRFRMARTYLDVADQASLRESDEGRNVAAGNAVLAAIAAADALCCLRLGRHARGQAHQKATALLKTVRPDGTALAKDLATVLGVKDAAHYGTVFAPPPSSDRHCAPRRDSSQPRRQPSRRTEAEPAPTFPA